MLNILLNLLKKVINEFGITEWLGFDAKFIQELIIFTERIRITTKIFLGLYFFNSIIMIIILIIIYLEK